MSLSHLTRYRVYSSRTKSTFLCIVAARSRGAALRVAKAMFYLTRTAHAVEEVAK